VERKESGGSGKDLSGRFPSLPQQAEGENPSLSSLFCRLARGRLED